MKNYSVLVEITVAAEGVTDAGLSALLFLAEADLAMSDDNTILNYEIINTEEA